MHCYFFHSNNGYAKVPQYYVICTVLILFDYDLVCRSIYNYKKNVKLSVSTAWRRKREHILNLDARLKWNIDFTPRRLFPKEVIPVAIECVAGWAVEPVWSFGKEKNLFTLSRFKPQRVQSVAQLLCWLRFFVVMMVTCFTSTPHWPASIEFNKEIIVDMPVSVFLCTVR
jgi:hypothetical protein